MESQINGDCLEFYLDFNLFSKDAVFKCAYWYLNHYSVDIKLIDTQFYKVVLQPKDKIDNLISEDKFVEIKNAFIDFNLRDIVSKETQNVRDLLTAKAFSNGEFDEEPPGSYTDPVGFTI